MPKHSPRLFGFTLIELLVVISIIGIMLAIGAASFSAAQKGARDARRRADIKAIQNVMEQHFTTNGTYAFATTGCNESNQSTVSLLAVSGETALSIRDPAGSAYYTCGNALAASYCACAQLEQTTKGNSTSNACANIGGASGTHYCVQQLQ